MRDYSKVSPKFWIGPTGKAIKKHGLEAVIVSMYLMTSPHSNMLGLFYQPVVFMAHETGLGLEGAHKGLAGCLEAGFCDYDTNTEIVWVFEMAAFQIADSLELKDNRCKGVQNEYNSLPTNPYLAGFFEKYSKAFHMAEKRSSEKVLEEGFEGASKPRAGTGTGTGTGAKSKPAAFDAQLDAEHVEKRSKRRPSEEDYENARWLYGCQLAVNPEAKKPNFDTWAGDVRLLREVDKRTHKEIASLFRFAKNDTFWSPNIQSPGKLREKWDQLTELRNKPGRTEAPKLNKQEQLEADNRAVVARMMENEEV